jgi:hypothetical protein
VKDPDRIISGFAVMRQRLMQVDTAYTPAQVQDRLLVIAILRDYAREGNAAGFTDYCQEKLARKPDLMVSVLEEFYGLLGLDPEKAMWDDMAALVL